jgi:hypothetical protein
MHKLSLLFESPPWLIGIGVLIGVLYAFGLYYRYRGPWGRNVQMLLAALRLILVTQLTLLLFGPLIRQIKNTYEAPAVVFAVDNSASVELGTDSTQLYALRQELRILRTQLEEKGYETDVRTFDESDAGSFADISFHEKSTNLHALLKGIQNDYESRNLSTVVLVSDGLYNLGVNPGYSPYPFPVYSVGVGDTLQRPDFNLNALLYNKIVYQGSRFPIEAEVFSNGMQGSELQVELVEGGEVLDRKNLMVQSAEQYDRIRFIVTPEESGMQRYTVQIVPKRREFTDVNNRKDAYVDVVEGRERILLAAPSPHPDLKAIGSAISSNENYEVEVYIPSIHTVPDTRFDAVVLHQAPDRKGQLNDLLQLVEREGIPVFYILGGKTDIGALNRQNSIVDIRPINRQTDQVFPAFNPAFNIFRFEEERVEKMQDYPPVEVPFANYALMPNSSVVLYQKVGNVQTSKPLLVTHDRDGRRSAILLGEGAWRWRLQEYAMHESQDAFDELFSKIIQYLTTREDKRRFRVYPLKNEYYDNETVVFETEVYNDIYEQIYGHNVTLTLTDEAGDEQGYSYVTSENNTRYRINGLQQGVYNYTASSVVDDRTMEASGIFTVRQLQIENTRIRADHNLLRNLAFESGGRFYLPQEIGDLERQLLGQEITKRIYTSESYMAIINMEWGFFVLILFAALEWFIRKYMGSY